MTTTGIRPSVEPAPVEPPGSHLRIPPVAPYLVLAATLAVAKVAGLLGAGRYRKPEYFYDDAYYYFRVARNIAAGLGSTYDGLQHTNGYHPLWQAILVPVFAIWQGPVSGLVAVRVLSAVLWFGVVLLVRRLGRAAGREATFWIGLIPITGLFMIQRHPMPFDGLETTVVVPALIWVLCLVVEERLLVGGRDDPRTARLLTVGAAFAVTALARLDSTLILATIGLAIFASHVARRGLRAAVRVGATIATPPALAVGGYVAYSYVVFRTTLPISAVAKMTQPPRRSPVALPEFLRAGGIGPAGLGTLTLLAVAGTAIVLVARRLTTSGREDHGQLSTQMQITAAVALVVLGQVLILVYNDSTNSWAVPPWYWYGATIALTVLPCVAASEGSAFLRGTRSWAIGNHRAVGALASVAAVLLVGGAGWWRYSVAPRRATNLNPHSVNAEVAERLNHELPASAVVAMGDEAGVFGYFLDRPLVQTEGLMGSSRYVRAIREGRVHRYLSELGVDYYARNWIVERELRLRSRGLVLGGTGDDGPRCGVKVEPVFGRGRRTLFQVCTDDLVLASAAGAPSRFAIWRYHGH